jgi:hypothetical protein
MHWAFQAQDHDIADGDNIFGIDKYAHGNDYDAFTALYANWASTLTLRNEALTHPKPILKGANIARQAIAMADSYLEGGAPQNAIDGDISAGSKWISENTPAPHWLALDLGRNVQLSGFRLQMAGLVEWYIFTLQAFEIQTASGLAGPWTTIAAVNNSAQFAKREVILDPPQTMRYVRLLVTDPGVDDYARLPEFEVYASPTAVEPGWALY